MAKAQSQVDRVSLGGALKIIQSQLEHVEEILSDACEAATPFVTGTVSHLMRAGGKRLRPALVVLSSLFGEGPNSRIYLTAAAIEMMHLATLYHDDVIDEADLRRGVMSANEKWGNTVAILAGDYLFAQASSLAAQAGGQVPGALSGAMARVVQGEIQEIKSAFDSNRTVDQYLSVIEGKTVALFEISVRLGTLLGGCSQNTVQALTAFGRAFGFAFQLSDDLLDLVGSIEMLGKPSGTDLRDGVYTLPIIFALESAPWLAQELRKQDVTVSHVRSTVLKTGAFEKALCVAKEYLHNALSALERVPDGEARDSMVRLTDVVLSQVTDHQ